ncbi:MAG: branched-chain amino acid ABC transporter permease [Planctomycetota bacterium]
MTPAIAEFIDHTLNGLILGGVFALIAVGYSLVYGIIGLINFAHGEIAMAGAFFTLLLARQWGGEDPGVGSLALALGASIILTALLGALVERLAYRPLRGASKLSALITTIGLSLLLQNLAAVVFGPRDLRLQLPSALEQTALSFGGVEVRWKSLVILVAALGAMVLLRHIVERTHLGRAMRAVSQDADAARLMGVDLNAVVVFTFVLGASMAALSASLLLLHVPLVRYDMGVQIGVVAFAAAVLGGIGSIPGAILGGVLIGLSQSYAAGYLGNLGEWLEHPSISSAYRESVAFLIMILILIVRPRGLMGRSEGDRA